MGSLWQHATIELHVPVALYILARVGWVQSKWGDIPLDQLIVIGSVVACTIIFYVLRMDGPCLISRCILEWHLATDRPDTRPRAKRVGRVSSIDCSP